MVCLKENVYWRNKISRIGAEKHMWTRGFYRYEHVYSYYRQKVQNSLERKLCNRFGQLLLIY